jgi:hypothetical protein
MVRLGLVSVYPPRCDGPAGHAADLVRALRRRADVVVCAVDRLGLTYPDEVIAVIAEQEPADHRRAGRILAEHAVDAVVIEYDETVGRGGRGMVELADELGRRGIPYLVAVHNLADPPATLADLTAAAARVLVFSDEARARALTLRLAEGGRLSVVPVEMSAAVARRIVTLGRGIVRRHPVPVESSHPVNLNGLDAQVRAAFPPSATRDGRRSTAAADVELYGRLAAVAAGLLAQPGEGPPAAGWPTALVWAGAAVPGLEARLHPRDSGWAIWGLGAIANASAVPEPLRRRARVRRNALAAVVPADPDPCALAVPGLVGAAAGGRRALARTARRLHRAAAGSVGWPWLADRLRPGAVRVPRALIAAGRALDDEEMVRAGVSSLDWYAGRIGLGDADGPARLPTPTERAVDIGATVEAFAEAYRATGRAHHGRLARRSFEWFAGLNRYGVPAHDPVSGTCLDALGLGLGLGADGRRSPSAGLAYLAALLALASADLTVLEPAGVEHLAAA